MNFLLSLFFLLTQLGFYDLQFTSIDGQLVSMNKFRGKKILLVNISTNSRGTGQLVSLQSLQRKYHNSLVIIAFPSNSFGHEPLTNSEIKEFCYSKTEVSYVLASKNDVAGINVQPVYRWLTNIKANSVTGDEVRGEFQKFLINESGEMIGIFPSATDPMDSLMCKAIAGH